MNTLDQEDRRILLWGDSITEGKPGVSFSDRLPDLLPEIKFFNFGKGGDTVRSLLTRLEALPAPAEQDKAPLALLWVGVNDVYADLIPGYGIWKTAMKQTPTRHDRDFSAVYRLILEHLFSHTDRILALNPLFVGEDPGFELNRRLVSAGKVIEQMTAEFPLVEFLDIRALMPLTAINPPRFLPVNPWSKMADALGRVSDDYFDKAAERRNLNWTYDGIHLNSRGAEQVAQIISAKIREMLRIYND